MKAAAIYLIAGVVTGWQLLRLVLWGVWGRPVHLLELSALCAAILLFVTSFLSMRRHKQTAVIALIATGILWLFYVPSLFQTLRFKVGPFSLIERVSLPRNIGVISGTVDLLRIVIPPLLLLCATIFAGWMLRGKSSDSVEP